MDTNKHLICGILVSALNSSRIFHCLLVVMTNSCLATWAWLFLRPMDVSHSLHHGSQSVSQWNAWPATGRSTLQDLRSCAILQASLALSPVSSSICCTHVRHLAIIAVMLQSKSYITHGYGSNRLNFLYHDIVCNSAMISRYRRWWSLVRLHCRACLAVTILQLLGVWHTYCVYTCIFI